ncbi:MAG: right-handed parallel beta-helix repeat-containing protein, partial [Eubacterium sp.]
VIHVSYSQGQHGIQKALNKARDKASASQPYEVVVEAGTYNLKKALHIYSNTELTCEPGVEFKETKRDNLLKVGRPGCDKQAHGFYYQNITINGGRWNRCRLHDSTGIKIAHAENVTLENAELCNAENSHLVETAGVDGLQITNCRFHNSGRTSPRNAGYECVQIDILSRQHFNGYEALDSELDYVSKNITVKNSSFDHVVRTVGSHTAVIGKPFQNVVFKNNTVTNCEDAGFYMRNVQGLKIIGNHIQSRGNGINVFNMVYTPNGYFLPRRGSRAYRASAEQVKGVIADNTIDSSRGNGIYLLGRNLKKAARSDSGESVPKGNYYVGNIKVKNNTIYTHVRGVSPVLITDGRRISVVANKMFRKKKSQAVRVTGGSRDIRIKKNTVKTR